MALIDKLTDIADAIREKTGTTDKLTLEAMPTAITAIETGGGGADLPDEAFLITGVCNYRFANNGWDWFIEELGDKVTTKDITSCYSMFQGSKVEQIPFDINIKNATSLPYMFEGVLKITTAPKIRGTIKWSTSTKLTQLLSACSNLRTLEDVFTPEMLEGFSTVKVTSAYSTPDVGLLLQNCYSLRQIPSWWYKFKLNPESTAFPSASSTLYYQSFKYCYSLNEVTNIPVWSCAGAQTSNMFLNTLTDSTRLKNLTFETNSDGSPIEAKWKSQIIDFAYVGYCATSGSRYCILNNNSGITADKEVTDDASYQALKNDPDWFTSKIEYSRYNHDSAVNTINSLPDTSAYLATAGGTNTIKFKGAAGSLTDGGAINTLTAEEIAVATAKGWTVTLS